MRDDDDEYESRRRPDNLMQQRLRRARGEEYDDDDEPPYRPPSRRYRYEDDGYRGSRGGGGALRTLLIVGLAAAAIGGALWVGQRLQSIGSALPDISVIVQTPTPQIVSGAAIIQRIQQLSRLETSSYTIERVIDIRQGSNIPIVGDFLAGDELLLIAHGSVVVGVDLGQLAADAVTVSPDGRSITLRLPPVQVLSAALDNSKTRVYSRERGLLAPSNENLETLARQTAEQEILRAACEDGIMDRGTSGAAQAMRQLLGMLDFASVEVITAPAGPCLAPSGL